MTDASVYDRRPQWSSEAGLNIGARSGTFGDWYKVTSRKFDLDTGIETIRYLIRFKGSIETVVKYLAEPAAVPSILVNLRKWANNDLSREITKWAVRPVTDTDGSGALEVILLYEPHWWYDASLRASREGIDSHLGETGRGQRGVVQQSISEPRIVAVVPERSTSVTSPSVGG